MTAKNAGRPDGSRVLIEPHPGEERYMCSTADGEP